MDKEALERIADVAQIDLLLAGCVLEELIKLGYRKLPKRDNSCREYGIEFVPRGE